MMRKNKLSAIMMVLVLVMAAALTGCSDKKAKEQEIQNKVLLMRLLQRKQIMRRNWKLIRQWLVRMRPIQRKML